MFQSPRPRGRTRPSAASAAPRQCRFNPRVLAGGRDVCARHRKNLPAVSIPASSREDATHCRRWKLPRNGFNPRVLAGGRDTLSGLSFCRGSCFNPRALTISQSRNLAISQSRNLAIMDCSLQAAGERKVKTMAKICQAETAIRGSLRVHDKRKPLNARRMPMHSFVSTPLQGTLDPME